MKFHELEIAGAFRIELDPHVDDRGFFARSFCAREFTEHGMNPRVVQCNISFNRKKGTLRGMHYQTTPFEEAKVVQCTHGAIFDVIIDLRPASPSYKKHAAVELSETNRQMLYVPEGCAHGFQTLADNTEVFYLMSEFYSPDHARGVRWNDPAFGIRWPEDERTIVPRDQQYPDFRG